MTLVYALSYVVAAVGFGAGIADAVLNKFWPDLLWKPVTYGLLALTVYGLLVAFAAGMGGLLITLLRSSVKAWPWLLG